MKFIFTLTSLIMLVYSAPTPQLSDAVQETGNAALDASLDQPALTEDSIVSTDDATPKGAFAVDSNEGESSVSNFGSPTSDQERMRQIMAAFAVLNKPNKPGN